jgi:FkbM family methyltransferase
MYIPFVDHIAQAAFRSVGLRVSRLSSSFEAAMMEALRRNRVDTVIDIGANAGQFAKELRALGYTGTIHSFEPLPDIANALRSVSAADPLWHVHEYALGDSDGDVSFFVTSNRVSSSLLQPKEFDLHSKVGAVASQLIQVPIRKLSTMAQNELKDVEWERTFLKLDVQGAEEMVLRGAESLLPKLPVLITEVSFQTLYNRSASWLDVMKVCIANGLTVVDFQRGFRDPVACRVLQADVLLERLVGAPNEATNATVA